MKKRSIAVAALFSLVSFSAFAGGNCNYGHDENLAKSAEKDVVNQEQVDPTLLALLKKQQNKTERMSPIITFN